MILKNTNETLELVTSTSSQIDVSISFSQLNSTTSTPSSEELSITSATTTTILSAPVASEQRYVLELSIKNTGIVTNTVVFQKKLLLLYMRKSEQF